MAGLRLFALYERFAPAFVRTALRPMINSPSSLHQFLTYLAIQGIAMAVDFTVLAVCLRVRVPVPVAVSLALALALGLHFFLNRHYNFRKFDRPWFQQARTYMILALVMSAFTVAWVELLGLWFAMPVLIAKILSMPVTAVLGYVTMRDLTFGPGIVAGIKSRFPKP